MLFYGPSGSGKKTLIIALLRQIFGPSADKVPAFLTHTFYFVLNFSQPSNNYQFMHILALTLCLATKNMSEENKSFFCDGLWILRNSCGWQVKVENRAWKVDVSFTLFLIHVIDHSCCFCRKYCYFSLIFR